MSDERDPGLSDHPSPKRDRVGGMALFFAFAGGPLAWFAYQNAAYALFATPCFPSAQRNTALPPESGWVWVLVLAAFLVCVAVAFLSGVVALRLLRRTHDEQAGSSGGLQEAGTGRTRFVAYWGVLLGFGFGIVILSNALALLVVPPCVM